MIQAQKLLYELGIVQQDVLNLNPFAPAQQVLDQAAKDCVTILAALKTGTYQSPGYPSATDPMAAYDPVAVNKASAAVIAMNAAFRSGNLGLFHADLDQLNEIHAGMGMAPVTFKPDIEVLANAPGQTGEFVRFIRQKIENGQTAFTNLPEAEKIITAAEAGSVPPPKPAVAIQVGQPSDPPQAPPGAIEQDAAGNYWQFFLTPFGQVWYRIPKPL